MVYKVCKGGVRSGNTLRGLSSHQAKRYAKQGCFVGTSSLGPAEVKELFESKTHDSLISDTLGSTNVILSMNKKQRWRLPATISHLIKMGCFNKNDAMVSVLERHKLKRRANCVSFHCNKGRFGSVVPKQKRYFSFNMNHVADEESQRKIRRAKYDLLKLSKKEKEKPDKRNDMRSLNVFTIAGSKKENASQPLESSKTEYRLEVFYPCPKSCSLAFNPKYTDVRMEVNEEGKMEMRSNVKVSRKTQKHRKRLTGEDFRKYDDEIFQNDVDDLWAEEEEDDDKYPYTSAESNTHINDTESTRDSENLSDVNILSFYDDEDVISPNDSSDDSAPSDSSQYLLTALIAQAEKARSLCSAHRPQRKKKQSVNHDDFTEDRSHIVYTDEVNYFPKREPEEEVKYRKTRSGRLVEIRKKKPKPVPVVEPKPTKPAYTPVHCAKVIIPAEETTLEKLKEKFGPCVVLSECEPLRFIVDITEQVVDTLSISPKTYVKGDYCSYLIFTYESFYDEQMNILRLQLNSNICKDTKRVCDSIPAQRSSLDEVINCVVVTLFEMKEEKLLNLENTQFVSNTVRTDFELLSQRMKYEVQSLLVSDQVWKNCFDLFQEKTNLAVKIEKLSAEYDVDAFCEICYNDVNPTHEHAHPGTRLGKCGHVFCDECLRAHCRAKMSGGALNLTCPGYQCDVHLDFVTLISLLHVAEVSKLLQRQLEGDLETKPNVKWCPNPTCGRVIQVSSEKPVDGVAFDVSCGCGMRVCFSCLGAAHWPASCAQAEDYAQRIETLKPPNETTDEPPIDTAPKEVPKKTTLYEIEGRMCPSCSRFMEKDGGCYHMTCKCGHQFCWNCMRSLASHDNSIQCMGTPDILYRYSRRLKVRHVELPKPARFDTPPAGEASANRKRRGQKTTMYQKALQQRIEYSNKRHGKGIKELSHKLLALSHKDLGFKREILALNTPDKDTVHYTDQDLLTLSVSGQVTKFLYGCLDLKLALHHVAEYTFVLLQGSPSTLERRRALKLASDISGFCSFITSVLETGSHQDLRTAVRRLSDIQNWAGRTLDVLLATVRKVQYE
ncbi:uncharacterized protein LOC131942189 [Physella acuta]|uniref:uncharacterized protein LOC131942189 n=1 Tax=Physella acuta TaxID=109671 RepID=UPI0027DC4A5F|nr:uncharacterized protein LOC131942189 [Physella acuta]